MNPHLTVYHMAAEIDAKAADGKSTRAMPSATAPIRAAEHRSVVQALAARLTSLLDAPRQRNADREAMRVATSSGA